MLVGVVVLCSHFSCDECDECLYLLGRPQKFDDRLCDIRNVPAMGAQYLSA